MRKFQEVRHPISVPVLTRSQAEELEKLRRDYSNKTFLYDMATGQDGLFSSDLTDLGVEKLAVALLVGYDIETTPEELISDEYKNGKFHCNAVNIEHAYRMGLVKAWKILRDGEPFPFEHPECNNSDESEK